MKNKGFLILFIIYVIMFMLDFISTFSGGIERARILEANPVFSYIGFGGIILLNLGILALFYYYYNKHDKPVINYIIIICMFYLILIRIFVVYNNFQWAGVDLTTQELEALATPAAKLETTKTIGIMYYIPLLCNLIPFLFWRFDHDIKKK